MSKQTVRTENWILISEQQGIPAGAFVKPVEWHWLPQHIKDKHLVQDSLSMYDAIIRAPVFTCILDRDTYVYIHTAKGFLLVKRDQICVKD